MKRSRAIKTCTAIALIFSFSPIAADNTLTIVGLGAVPDFDPDRGTEWTLSSSCVDINESGQAACQSAAIGPVYRCGWRNAQRCSSKVKRIHRWEGGVLTDMSSPDASYDVPLEMNNHGAIAGYAYVNEVYPSEGGNGRIWHIPGSPDIKSSLVRSINDSGEYVQQWFSSPGGIAHYESKAYFADGTEQPLAGVFVRPFVISNKQHIIGAQILQSFVPDSQSPTGDEIAEVSGVGWLLDQSQIDNLKRNEAGNLDDDGYLLYPSKFYRPAPTRNYETTVSDVNDFGEFATKTRFGGLFNGSVCTPNTVSTVRDIYGGRHTVPWKCNSTNYHRGTYAGGKAYVGINNIGDAVGILTPGAYVYKNNYGQLPRIWLKVSLNKWKEFNANDLLPADSGYTIKAVSDINSKRQVVGTCKNTTTAVLIGCILDLSDHPIPAALKKPSITITAPDEGSTVSGNVTIEANAFDRNGFVSKVIFRVGNKTIAIDNSEPYSATWDSNVMAAGSYDVRVIAVDNENNRRAAQSTFIVGNVEPPIPGTPVEGEGTITLVNSPTSIEIDAVATNISSSTVIKFNEVSGFEVGLSIQYKGIMTAAGIIEATELEVN